ncbi:MAG: hypothetical protein ACSLEN_14200 [Candidatus Malihini olakiniferum]
MPRRNLITGEVAMSYLERRYHQTVVLLVLLILLLPLARHLGLCAGDRVGK